MDLAAQTVVGLPRSNLVKKSDDVASAASAANASPEASSPSPANIPPPPASVLAAASPFAIANPFSVPSPFGPFAEAPTVEALVPDAPSAPERESFRTKADSVEVSVESQRAPETFRERPLFEASPAVAAEPARGQYSSSPSAEELLERAAALGPARMTWESIVLPADPILHEKSTPHVAERRARLTRMVKIGLAACLGVCVLALGVSALSGDASAAPAASADAGAKTVPSKGVIPVEPLDGTRHAKAVRRVAPAVTTAAIVRNKHR